MYWICNYVLILKLNVFANCLLNKNLIIHILASQLSQMSDTDPAVVSTTSALTSGKEKRKKM